MLDNVTHLHARGSKFTEISGGVYTFVNGQQTPHVNPADMEHPSHHAEKIPNEKISSSAHVMIPQTTPESSGEPFPPSYTETVHSSRAFGKSFVTSG
jgi:hypothetical protein